MSDIGHALPDFVLEPELADVLQALEDNHITTSDLLSLGAVDIAKRLNIAPGRVLQVAAAATAQLHTAADSNGKKFALESEEKLGQNHSAVTLLDDDLTRAAGGGIRPGCITEVVGPSGVGKTQFLLLALLSTQLPAPYGLGRPSLYISTEHGLPTQRLAEMLQSNPVLMTSRPRPSLAQILTLHAPDLETQDHVLQFQLPVVLERHNIGLVVIDSIAANYRAEDIQNARTDQRGGGNQQGRLMSNRSSELIRLGASLRDMARRYNTAFLVANQVADRLEPLSMATADASGPRTPGSSPAAPASSMGSSQGGTLSESSHFTPEDILLPSSIMTLDHQQRWFTGWGDLRTDNAASGAKESSSLKTPALGLVWTNQITCRISLHKQADWGRQLSETTASDAVNAAGLGGADWSTRRWRRRIRLAFAPWSEACGEDDVGTEYEIWAGGLRCIKKET